MENFDTVIRNGTVATACETMAADIGIREISGKRRLSAVGCFGPLSSFSRSTICRKPPLLVP